ncbi:MAG: hypothetical protein PHQ72_00535 [Hespellia sp.]|nr:hypothetical protein [Hespellia sp.]
MNRVILDEKIGITYNASSKARDDAAYFVSSYVGKDGGKYHVLGSNDKSHIKSKWGKIYVGIKALLKLFFSLKDDDVVFAQSSLKIIRKLDFIRRLKKSRSILLIHDLDALRDSYEDDDSINREIEVLNRQDVVIVHNESMKQELRQRGCKINLVSLQIFDYYTNAPIVNRRFDTRRIEVCFAGNLSPRKTGFLYRLDENDMKIKFNIYGRKEKELKKLCYCGCYEPERLPEVLQGQFGLIWEGNDYSYNETEHPYIMFNNPHKASLYIVSCLPIIVWEKAAIAEYVKRENIGITISNLDEIEERLFTITVCEYDGFLENIKRVRSDLLKGKHLHDAIAEAETFLMQTAT